jgi:hypothetical protein
MNRATFVVLTGVSAASFFVSSATFAQVGGNGQGGLGAGNAHGPATAGMTYHGDPISSPWVSLPAGWGDQTGMNQSNAKQVPPNDGTNVHGTDVPMDSQ